MNADFNLAGGGGLRREPPALAEADSADEVPVVRDTGFVRLSPTSFSFERVPDGADGRVEITFQRLSTREVARRLAPGPDGGHAVAGRDVRLEVCELGAVELSREALLGLRREIDRYVGAPPEPDAASGAAAQQLLASTRSELSGMQDALAGKIDDLARRVDGWGGRMTAVRAELARDLEQLVRLLWPKDRIRK